MNAHDGSGEKWIDNTVLIRQPPLGVLTVSLTDQASYASVNRNWLPCSGNSVDYIIDQLSDDDRTPPTCVVLLVVVDKCSKLRDRRALRDLLVEEIWLRYRIRLSDDTED